MLRPSHLRAILLPLRLTEPLHTVHHHGVPLRPTTVVFQRQQKQQRPFHRSPALAKKQMPPRPKPPPENEIEESFIKGSGPGGQKINKTSSAVQLKHLPTGLVVKCQATRSRSQNRKIARELLALKLEQLEKGDQSRAAIVAETKRKRAASKIKKSRRKYRQLEEEEEKEKKEAQEEEVGKKKKKNNNSGLPAGLDPVVLAAMTGMGHIVVPNVAAAVSATATTTAATRPVGGGGGTVGQSGRNDVDDEEEDDEEEWEEEEEEEYEEYEEEEDEEEWEEEEEEEAEEEDEYDELGGDSDSNLQNNTKTKPPGKKAQR